MSFHVLVHQDAQVVLDDTDPEVFEVRVATSITANDVSMFIVCRRTVLQAMCPLHPRSLCICLQYHAQFSCCTRSPQRSATALTNARYHRQGFRCGLAWERHVFLESSNVGTTPTIGHFVLCRHSLLTL